MLRPKDFIAAWGKEVPLKRFGKKSLELLTISDEDKAFLAEAGLPSSAAPFLNFESPKSGELPTVAKQWKQSDAFDRYRVIGSDGSGNPIAIDEGQAGQVVRLDHEDKFARTFINTTIHQFAESLLAYRDILRDLDGEDALPEKARKQLHQRLKKIDPAAMKPACFWPEETTTTEAGDEYPASVLRELSSPDAATRLKASKQLESDLRNSATEQRRKQFGSAKVTSEFIAALDDPDPKVVHNAVVALAQITRNYFKDDRAYTKLLSLVRSKHPLTSRWAIDAVIHLREEASLSDVLPLCTDPSQEARAMVLNHLDVWLIAKSKGGSPSIRPENQERIQTAALQALKDEDATVRGNAALLLRDVGDAAALAALKKILKKEPHWLTKQNISNAIAGLEKRV